MKRRLRIAVSVFFALVAVATLIMWPRSYWKVATIQWTAVNNSVIGVQVIPGSFRFFAFHSNTTAQLIPGWIVDSENVVPEIDYGPQLDWSKRPNSGHLSLPPWLIALTSAAIAAIAWPKRSYQFSLRTMLIATTLVAVVLGLGVWASR